MRNFDYKRVIKLAYKGNPIPEVVWLNDMHEFFQNFETNYGTVSGFNFAHWQYMSVVSKPVQNEKGNAARLATIQPPHLPFNSIVFGPLIPNDFDELIDEMYERYDSHMEKIQEDIFEVEPTLPTTLEDYLFLGPFGWVKRDLEIFHQVDPEGKLDKDGMMWVYAELLAHDMFLLTFENVVFIGPVNSKERN